LTVKRLLKRSRQARQPGIYRSLSFWHRRAVQREQKKSGPGISGHVLKMVNPFQLPGALFRIILRRSAVKKKGEIPPKEKRSYPVPA
jgi:hypothetical protein